MKADFCGDAFGVVFQEEARIQNYTQVRGCEDKVREVLLKEKLLWVLWVVLLRGLGEISIKSARFSSLVEGGLITSMILFLSSSGS